MRYASTRIAIGASLAFLVVWIASSLLMVGVSLPPDGSTLFRRPAWSVELPAFGFVGLMIMGMAQHFVPLFSGRRLRSERAGLAQVGLAIGAVVLNLVHPSLEALAKGLWLSASLLFVALIVVTLRQPRSAERTPEGRPGLQQVDRAAIPMTAVALIYLVASSAGFLLASPRAHPLSPAAARYWSSYLHLYTLGFIALMIFGVGFHLFPRFWEATPPLWGVKAVRTLALIGPAAVAGSMPLLGTQGSSAGLVVASALLEASAAVLFALLVIDLWHRSPKRRAASLFHVAGVSWLLLGVGLGALMGLAPSAFLGWAPVHGWINLLGFAGFQIFGVTHEVLPPYASRGLAAIRRSARTHLFLGVAGLGFVVLGRGTILFGVSVLGGPLSGVGLGALLAMALSYFAGTVLTLRGIARPRGAS